MLAAAAAGADVVDVAIDSQYLRKSPIHCYILMVLCSRHVRTNLATAYGCYLLCVGADRLGNRYPLL